jgi:hypothetical protein
MIEKKIEEEIEKILRIEGIEEAVKKGKEIIQKMYPQKLIVTKYNYDNEYVIFRDTLSKDYIQTTFMIDDTTYVKKMKWEIRKKRKIYEKEVPKKIINRAIHQILVNEF